MNAIDPDDEFDLEAVPAEQVNGADPLKEYDFETPGAQEVQIKLLEDRLQDPTLSDDARAVYEKAIAMRQMASWRRRPPKTL